MIFNAIANCHFPLRTVSSIQSNRLTAKPVRRKSKAVAFALSAALILSSASSPVLATGGYGGGSGMTVSGPECSFAGPARDLLPESITYKVRNTGRSYIYVTVTGTQGLLLSPSYLSIPPNQVKEVRVKANIDRRRPATYRGSINFSGPSCSDVKKSCIITVTDPNPVSP